jgi:hypothetical protein
LFILSLIFELHVNKKENNNIEETWPGVQGDTFGKLWYVVWMYFGQKTHPFHIIHQD